MSLSFAPCFTPRGPDLLHKSTQSVQRTVYTAHKPLTNTFARHWVQTIVETKFNFNYCLHYSSDSLFLLETAVSKSASKNTDKKPEKAPVSKASTDISLPASEVPSSATDEKKLSARGEAARAKLKRAALEVMEKTGYHRMRIHDVTSEAGVAAGLFYHYFKDLKSLTLEVLEDFIAEARNVDAIEKGVPKGNWYARIHAHFSLVVDSYADRPGLMRCLLQMADEDQDFAERIRLGYMEQLNWLVQLMPKLFPDAKFEQHQAFLVIYTLASSGEMMLRDYFINQDKKLHAEKIDRQQLTELLTTVFYRGLFLENPPAEQLEYTKNLQHMKRI